MKNYIEDLKYAIYFSKVEWNSFRKKRVLITGASGMIGRCIVDMLMQVNIELNVNTNIFVLVRDKTKAERLFSQYIDLDFFCIIEGDVCDNILYPQVDYIIHAASYGDPAAFVENPVGVMKANLYGTVNLIEHAIMCNARMVFISTGEIYGYIEKKEAFKEEDIGLLDFNKIRSCYPESKRAAETLCQSYIGQYNADILICRPCHIYGQTMTDRDSRVIAQFIRNAINKQNIVMKSNGKQIRSMCYVVDAVSAILTVLIKGKQGEVYNISNMASSITIKELAGILAEITGTKVVCKLSSGYEKRGYSVSDYQVLDNKKICCLGWNANMDIKEGLQRVIKDILASNG